MSHPSNKLERFLLGKHKGEKRSKGYWNGFLFEKDVNKRREKLKEDSKIRRNTTKLCSCSMCGNPRRKSWKDKLTLQEKKFFESLEK